MDICFYLNRVIYFMQISLLAKLIFFLTIYCISDISIKNNILRKAIKKANKAKPIN